MSMSPRIALLLIIQSHRPFAQSAYIIAVKCRLKMGRAARNGWRKIAQATDEAMNRSLQPTGTFIAAVRLVGIAFSADNREDNA